MWSIYLDRNLCGRSGAHNVVASRSCTGFSHAARDGQCWLGECAQHDINFGRSRSHWLHTTTCTHIATGTKERVPPPRNAS